MFLWLSESISNRSMVDTSATARYTEPRRIDLNNDLLGGAIGANKSIFFRALSAAPPLDYPNVLCGIDMPELKVS